MENLLEVIFEDILNVGLPSNCQVVVVFDTFDPIKAVSL